MYVRSHMEYARGLVGEIETSIYRACNRLHLHLPLLSNVKTRRLSVHILASIPPCLAQCQHALKHALRAIVLVAIAAQSRFLVCFTNLSLALGTCVLASSARSASEITGAALLCHTLGSAPGTRSSRGQRSNSEE